MAEKRIIAIAVSPTAYDEIRRLKGQRTWSGYVLGLTLLENPENKILNDELANLTKHKPNGKKAKASKSEPKTKKEV